MASVVGSQSSDVELMFPGDRYPVSAGPILVQTGWRGGQWVQFVTSPFGDFFVEASDGNRIAGFILFQSEYYPPTPNLMGSPENWIAHQPRHCQATSVTTMLSGGVRAFFRVYETEALAGGTRSGGPITYTLNENLYVSENGLLCNDSAVQLALAGVVTPQLVGIVSAIPSTGNENRLAADIHW